MVNTDNNPLACAHKGKLGAYQIRWLNQLALFDFVINIRMDRSFMVTFALNHHPLSPDWPLESDANSDELKVMSYPLACDYTFEDHVEATSYQSVYGKVNWHLVGTKIMNDLKVEAQTISCVVEPLIRDDTILEIVAQSNAIKVFDQVTPATITKG